MDSCAVGVLQLPNLEIPLPFSALTQSCIGTQCPSLLTVDLGLPLPLY